MTDQVVSADFPFTMQYVDIEQEVKMAYIDTHHSHHGSHKDNIPVVFVHGNPTYSYMWRNIIPYVPRSTRAVAPDLIGYGASSKAALEKYGFDDHNRYLDTFFDKVIGKDQPVVLVLHDFGSLLGFHWARRHANQVKGLVFMEFHPPMPTWNDTGAAGPAVSAAMHGTTEEVTKRVLQDNIYIELFVPDQVVRTLSAEEMDRYRAPFPDIRSREAILGMSKLFPVAGNPPDAYEAVAEYNKWLLENEIPKLFFSADPGKIIPPTKAKYYSDNLKNVTSIAAGKAKHFVPEDQPHVIGAELAKWLEKTGLSRW